VDIPAIAYTKTSMRKAKVYNSMALIRLKKLLFFWGPPVVWALVIFWFSSRPTGSVSEVHWQDFVFKKFLHVSFFGFLAVLIYRALINNYTDKLRSLKWATVATVVYGFLDELHQSFTAGRQPTVRDVVFDTLGALIAVYLIWFLLPTLPKPLKYWVARFQIK